MKTIYIIAILVRDFFVSLIPIRKTFFFITDQIKKSYLFIYLFIQLGDCKTLAIIYLGPFIHDIIHDKYDEKKSQQYSFVYLLVMIYVLVFT